MTTATRAAATRLDLRLPGEWVQFLPHDPEARAKLRRYVEAAIGDGDANARARALLTERLREALAILDQGRAESLLLCIRVSPRLPLPLLLLVFPSAAVTVPPAAGARPEAVVATLRKALVAAGDARDAELVELETPVTRVLRSVRVTQAAADPRAPEVVRHELAADYWFAVPGTKQVAWVSAFTPFGEIATPMTAFLDSIARLARFASATEG